MGYVFLGFIAFVLFFLYDINSVLWKNGRLHRCFMVGCFVLTVATILAVVNSASIQTIDYRSIIFLLLTIGCFILFVYTLFFALPFDKTYKEITGPAQVYTGGVYSLCRHPGVIWMFFFYLFLGLFLNSSTIVTMSVVYTIFNVIYVLLQDVWTFPNTLLGYAEYKKMTPFLIPTPESIQKLCKLVRKSGDEG